MTNAKGYGCKFCIDCGWVTKVASPNFKLDKCPNCSVWLIEAHEYEYYNKLGELVAKEAWITDNDEWTLSGEKIDDLVSLIVKAKSRLIRRENYIDESAETDLSLGVSKPDDKKLKNGVLNP